MTILVYAALALAGALSFARALCRGWRRTSDAELRALLPAFPPLERGGRVYLSRGAERTEGEPALATCLYRWVSRGTGDHRRGRHEAWLIVPAPPGAVLPNVSLEPRTGGLLERAALGVAAHFGHTPLALSEAWRPLHVGGSADPAWFTDARAERLSALLGPRHQLWLHGRVAVLALPAEDHPRLMADADQLGGALREALA